MGVVYLARDPRLGRSVAVKVFALPDGITEEQKSEFRERFLREAQAAGGLSHSGIVTVYDSDEDPERGPFIAMEFVPGKSLAELLEADGPLEPERVFAMVQVLAEGLAAAHRAGIVHRDLKPANILVHESDGSAKIADFGVARLATSNLTRTGTTVGSPTYMSPEQIQGRPVAGRSDLCSLAAVLYECLGGEAPFSGEDLPQLAYSIVHDTPVPISKRAPGLSPALDRFFDRALAKDPAKRFQDAAELCRELQQARQAPDPGTPTRIGAPLVDDTAIAVDSAAEPPGPVAVESERPIGRGEAMRPMRIGNRGKVAVALVVVALIAWIYWNGSGGAYVRIKGESSVRSGTLTVTVDGKRAYSRELAAGNKAMGMLKNVVGKGAESFDVSIEVKPGRHEIEAYVVTDDRPRGHRDSVTIDVERGETRRIRLSAGSAFGAPLALNVN